MKKIIGVLLITVACLLVATPSQAQLRWGLKAGLNLNKVDYSGFSENFKSENMTGFFVGPMAEFTLPIVGLGVDASLLYSQRGAKLTDISNNQVETDKVRQHSLEIPINLKYSIGLGDMAGVFVAAGPSFAFDLKNDKIFNEIKQRKSNVGINVGLGVKLINHLQIAANYNIPLTKTVDETIDGKEFSAKNKTWQLSLAYMF